MDKHKAINNEQMVSFFSPQDGQGLQCPQHRCRSAHSEYQPRSPSLARLWSPSWLRKWSLTRHRPLARSLSAPSRPDLWPWRYVAGLKHQWYGNTWQTKERFNNHYNLVDLFCCCSFKKCLLNVSCLWPKYFFLSDRFILINDIFGLKVYLKRLSKHFYDPFKSLKISLFSILAQDDLRSTLAVHSETGTIGVL